MGHPYCRGSELVGIDLHVYISAGREWDCSCGLERDEGGCTRRLRAWCLFGSSSDGGYDGTLFLVSAKVMMEGLKF